MQFDMDHSNPNTKKQGKVAFSTRSLSRDENGLLSERKQLAESFKYMGTGAASATSTQAQAVLPNPQRRDPSHRLRITDPFPPNDDVSIHVEEVRETCLNSNREAMITQGSEAPLPDAPSREDEKSLTTNALSDLQPRFELQVGRATSPMVTDNALVQSSALGEFRRQKFVDKSMNAPAGVESWKSFELVSSLGDAMCSNDCDAEDSQVSHWCCECQKAICGYCVITHTRQARMRSHVLVDIEAMLREQEHLDERLARCKVNSLECARRLKVEDEKQKVKTDKRMSELESEAARAVAALEEELRRMKEEEDKLIRQAEQESQRRKAEEVELVREKQKLEESLSQVKLVVPFRNVLSTTASNSGGSQTGMLGEGILEVREERNEITTDMHRGQSSTALAGTPTKCIHFYPNERVMKGGVELVTGPMARDFWPNPEHAASLLGSRAAVQAQAEVEGASRDAHASESDMYDQTFSSPSTAAIVGATVNVGNIPPPAVDSNAKGAGAGAVDDMAQRPDNSPRYSNYVKNLQARLFNLMEGRNLKSSGERFASNFARFDEEFGADRPLAIASILTPAMTPTDKSQAMDHEAAPVAVVLADREGGDEEEAQRELGPWFRQLGLSEAHAKDLAHRFSKPDFGVTNQAILFSLDDTHVDEILESSPLGHKVVIKKALKREKNE